MFRQFLQDRDRCSPTAHDRFGATLGRDLPGQHKLTVVDGSAEFLDPRGNIWCGGHAKVSFNPGRLGPLPHASGVRPLPEQPLEVGRQVAQLRERLAPTR